MVSLSTQLTSLRPAQPVNSPSATTPGKAHMHAGLKCLPPRPRPPVLLPWALSRSFGAGDPSML
eukprot:15197513-Alexandrium_andersonii.AAC.1